MAALSSVSAGAADAASASAKSSRRWIVAAVLVASLAGLGALYYHNQLSKRRGLPRKDADGDRVSDDDDSTAAIRKAEEGRVDQPKKDQKSAHELKNLGNEQYKARNFKQALEYYSRAIELQPNAAIFWCNRAACHANLDDPKSVILDCNQALKLDFKYKKALYRRAMAYEQLGELRNALTDYTCITVLEHHKESRAMEAMERLLRTLSEEESKVLFPTKKPMLPSPTFVAAYLEAFRNKPKLPTKDKVPAGSAAAHLHQALDAIETKKYLEADVSTANAVRALSSTDSKEVTTAVHEMKGTFLFLKGQVDEAAEAFENALIVDDKNISVMIKVSNILMEKNDPLGALGTFDKAIEVDAKNADIYYHRGQVKFLLNDLDGAMADYERSIELDPDFPSSYIQLAVSQYKLGNIERAMEIFNKALKQFPKNADVLNFYGELLMDQGRLPEAMECYDKCTQLAPQSPMAYINKATLQFQAFHDVAKAEELLRTALKEDPSCDLIYVQLANLLLPQGKVDEATEFFDQAIHLARTQPELANAIIAKESNLARYRVSVLLPPEVIRESLM